MVLLLKRILLIRHAEVGAWCAALHWSDSGALASSGLQNASKWLLNSILSDEPTRQLLAECRGSNQSMPGSMPHPAC
jgi:hypothetical protein